MTEQKQFDTREQWLAARELDVTASAVGCLLDGVVHPYVTPAQLHLLKTGQASDDSGETAAQRRGKLLEQVVLDILAQDFPQWQTMRNRVPGAGRYYRDPALRIGATPDAFAMEAKRGKGIIQIKSVAAPAFAKWKDDAGNLAAPAWIVAQAVTEAKLTGAKWAAIAVLVVGFGLDLHVIEVPLDDGLWEHIQVAVAAFWERIELGLGPDFDIDLDGPLIASLWKRDDGSTIDLTGDNAFIDALHARETLKDEEKAIKDELDRCTTLIKMKMQAAETAIAGSWVVTLKTTHRRGYTVAPTTVRTLRAKQMKEAKHE